MVRTRAAEERVTYAVKRCCNQHSLWVRAQLFAMQLCGKHVSATVNQYATIEEAVFPLGPPRDRSSRVEAGSNIYTVALQVAGGDKKGSLESRE
jgi:hypothetical protein